MDTASADQMDTASANPDVGQPPDATNPGDADAERQDAAENHRDADGLDELLRGGHQLTPEQWWKRHRRRQLTAFITFPALILGTGSIATAFSTGLFDHTVVKPACTPTVVQAPAKSSFSVSVMNATGQSGKATTVARELEHRKFKVSNASTAPDSLLVRDPALIYYGRAGLDQALLVQQQVAGSALYYDGRTGKNVTLVIGLGFKKLVDVPPAPPPLPREIKVNVYNTTFRSGLAKTAADKLEARGFKGGKVGNDPELAFLPKNTAVIRFGPDAQPAAKVLAQHVPGAQLKLVEDRAGTALDLVIGNRYTDLVPLADVPAPPPRPVLPPPTVARPCASS
jgi:hypothetical protein